MKGLIVFSHGMEDNEALSTLSLLRRAGLSIDSVTKEENLFVTTAYGLNVQADKKLDNISLDIYDFLIVPGGAYVDKIIDNATYMYDLIQSFANRSKDIYAICAAPRFLGRLGLLDNLEYTGFPGSEKDSEMGQYLADKKVVVTPKVITARSAGAVIEFVYEIIKKNQDEMRAKSLINNIMY